MYVNQGNLANQLLNSAAMTSMKFSEFSLAKITLTGLAEDSPPIERDIAHWLTDSNNLEYLTSVLKQQLAQNEASIGKLD